MHLVKNYLEYQVNLGFTQVILPKTRAVSLVSKKAESGSIVLESIRKELGDCKRCPLHSARLSIVFGEGNPNAELMFVGEGPGADEDREGKPFVGRAGQLLTKMIRAMGFDRSEVYIANIVKCLPPENRNPKTLEISTCLPFLKSQVTAVKPRVVVALGRIATSSLLNTTESLSNLRGQFHDFDGILLMPTYHPSFLLRQERDRKYKAEAWEHLQKVMAYLKSTHSHLESKDE
ncbi:MAG: uracil-DNA glycosylase [Desulfomonile tiedjei]|uniref:Type-4 uracil-DNA glycosylase n=1 Tax=Desulfomonile tiedjei TaxID=2358 RepID=A0A9D6V500_9BACT|nr:uracil-DNA glycosylase [Desulfomonile tiedjei]